MARMEDLLAKPAQWTIVNTGIAAIATATKAGIQAQEHYVCGVSISCSGLPATSVIVQLLDGVGILDQWELPAAMFAPIISNFTRPYKGSPGNLVSLVVGSFGAGNRGTAVLRGWTAMAG